MCGRFCLGIQIGVSAEAGNRIQKTYNALGKVISGLPKFEITSIYGLNIPFMHTNNKNFSLFSMHDGI